MIHFNELYVTEDGAKLIIDVEIDHYSVYEGTLIDCIKVDIGENVTEDGISNKAIVVWDKDNEYVYTTDDEEIIANVYPRNPKLKETHVRLCLSAKDLKGISPNLNLLNHLFIVRVEADYNESVESLAQMTCDWESDGSITGVAYNSLPLYNQIVRLSENYGDSCDDTALREFMDYIMRYYGFIFALRAGDLPQAVNYWNNYLNGTISTVPTHRKCGCHGSY